MGKRGGGQGRSIAMGIAWAGALAAVLGLASVPVRAEGEPAPTPAVRVRLQSPFPGVEGLPEGRYLYPAAPVPTLPGPAISVPTGPVPTSADTPALRGMSYVERNRERYAVDPGEEKLLFPKFRDDPMERSGIRPGEYTPFLFPGLMNLIYEDRWQLEEDPDKGIARRFRRQARVDIRDPAPDTANFPNSAYTLPKGRVYIENSPVGFYGASHFQPRVYQWETLFRYGLTDNLEFRLFTNGLTAQAGSAQLKDKPVTGYSPVVFDFKMNFWEENTEYHLPAMGFEVYLQTTFGTPTFNAGTQPSMNILFDQELPFGIELETNFGIAGVQDGAHRTHYQFGFQWAFQRQVVKDFDIFVHGFYNEAALPRILQFRSLTPAEQANRARNDTVPTANVVGAGAIWTVSDRLAIYGSYNFGTNGGSPATIALLGFAYGF